MCCRGYSLPLQRAITDFGADIPFGRVADKLREHYGIDIPLSAAATITQRHAHAVTETDRTPDQLPGVIPLALIAEADGSMIPIVQCATSSEAGSTDRRKRRTLFWKEARLSLIRRPDDIAPSFAVTLGDAAATGADLERLAVAAGLNRRTRIHGLGDGAPWIAEQMESRFGAQARYLIDFYHLCDYLAAAASACAPATPDVWLALQKERFKSGRVADVITDLVAGIEPENHEGDSPVRACHRYITNRPGQFDYPAAIAANLPIGSGEVESAHRSVIQKRLKLPGAWWRLDRAQDLLNLRCLRANSRWNDYWIRIAA